MTTLFDEFEIIIKRKTISEVDSVEGVLVLERPYTDKENDDSGHYAQQSAGNDKPYTKKVYEDRPVKKQKTDEKEIFKQIVPAQGFDLKKVIDAINYKPTPNAG